MRAPVRGQRRRPGTGPARQLEPGEITARLGAPWIPPADIETFCGEVLAVTVDIEHLPELGRWSARLADGSRRSVALSSEWGTARADAVTLLDAGLNQRLHTVTDPTPDGRRVRNDSETLAARDKQEQLAARFSAWVWQDPDRAARLAGRYNWLFSSTVAAVHDGGHLSLPGLASGFTPHPHQRDAVARIVTDGRALLAHAVGAGKTATMVMAAMELRRLGSVTKPAVVVPNHMLDQFTREWLQLYPTARILVADRERLSRDRRTEFVARAATGDWDGIIFTHAGFARLPLGGDLMAGYLGEEIETNRRALAASLEGKALSVKRLERRIAQLEETYKRLLAADTKDDGVRFEETGVDYLFIDEAHAYKNRRVDTVIDGVANVGSQRAQDLDAKLWALRRRHGPRVVTFATATPVANSMAELWVMQTYLHPDLLTQVDLRAFDAWAAAFGRTHTALELAPDGGSYRMQTRFARFQNIPELLGLYRQVADVRTTDDLRLPTPTLVGGGAETVVVAPSDTLAGYVADLYERPANAFVAGFVGSPPMNLLPAHVEAGDNGGLTVRIGEQRIGVGARAIGRYPQVRQRVGTSIIVGIRPEQLHLPDPSTPDDRRLSGEVVVAEALGSEHVVHLTLATSGADDEVAGGVLADVRHAREVTAVEGGRESSSGSAGSRRPSRAHASSSPWPTTACTSSTP